GQGVTRTQKILSRLSGRSASVNPQRPPMRTGSVMGTDHVEAGPDESHGVILYLEDITVSFDGFRALNALTLYVGAGELLCIIGPNGAGKTTMMDVITGKTHPDSGTAWFGSGIDLLKLSEPEIVRAGIGRKFQKPTVFEQLTVFENLELALAGGRSFLKTFLAGMSPAQHKRVDEV